MSIHSIALSTQAGGETLCIVVQYLENFEYIQKNLILPLVESTNN